MCFGYVQIFLELVGFAQPFDIGLTFSKIADLGVDAVEGEMTDLDDQWLKAKLALYGMEAPNGVENMTKIVSGKQLWNYDNLEPSEKKLVL